MTNFEKIKQMSVENMAEMLLDESEKHFTYCNHCSHQSFYAPHCTSSNVIALAQKLGMLDEEERDID